MRQESNVQAAKQPPTLQVRGLEVRYGQRIGCQHINFDTYAGERVAVIGPNGAGKSTLFKAIVGLLPVHRGSIAIGENSHQKQHGRVGYVPQHEAVDWQFPANVWDVVMMARTRHIGYFLPPRKRDRQAVQQALMQVDMWELRQRQIGELSGGQRRRVFIARALAQGASVVLMDEPFAGVDATAEADIFGILDVLRDNQITVIVATHNLAKISGFYDRVLMVNLQQIAFGRPDEEFTAENLSQTFGGKITLWRGDNQTVAIADDACCPDEHHHHQH
jgi:ABC-type Mn2+/Zn2+ transport system ATPase subunit